MNTEAYLLHLLLAIPAFPRVFSQIVNDFIVEEVKMVDPLHDLQGC